MDELTRALDETADRYGAVAAVRLHLAGYGRIRIAADRLGVETIDREGRSVVIRFRPTAPVDPIRLLNVGLRMARAAFLPARHAEDGSRRQRLRPRLRVGRPAQRVDRSDRRDRRSKGATVQPSWWTSRATSGTVEPGFTREDVLRQVPGDPLAPGGVFERVEESCSGRHCR
jgi:hypothetical protein